MRSNPVDLSHRRYCRDDRSGRGGYRGAPNFFHRPEFSEGAGFECPVDVPYAAQFRIIAGSTGPFRRRTAGRPWSHFSSKMAMPAHRRRRKAAGAPAPDAGNPGTRNGERSLEPLPRRDMPALPRTVTVQPCEGRFGCEKRRGRDGEGQGGDKCRGHGKRKAII